MGGQALEIDKEKGEGREQLWNVDPDRPIVIGHDTEDGPEHPLWDEDVNMPIDEGMVADMMINGILQPVKARKDGRGSDAPLHITKGRQRTKNAREANKRLKKAGQPLLTLPLVIEKIDDKQALLQTLSENMHRREFSSVDKAKAIHRLVEVHKIPIAEACVSMDASIQQGRAWLKWFDLDRSVQKAHDKGQIGFTAAVELADLERADQKKKLEELIAAGGTITVSKTRLAKAQGKEAKGRKSKATTKYPAPHKRTIKKIVEHGKEYGIPSSFMSHARFFLGETNGSNISGLTALLRDIEAKKI